MKHKLLSITAIIFAVATVVGLTKLVFADTTGNIPPTADGTYLQWKPNTSTIHYTMVDEVFCNGTTDYNYTKTVGNKDSYVINISSIPLGATINTITITPCASANLLNTSTPVTSSIALFYRLNGGFESVLGSGYNFQSDWNTPIPLSSTVFNGLGIIKQPSTTLEAGAKFVSGMAGARLSQIYASVSFTPTTSTPPTVTTTLASSVKKFSATLNGQANPNGKVTTGWFRYSTVSPGTCNDTFGTKLPLAPIALGSGNASVAYSTSATGLSSGTTYFYCAIASNTDGKGFGLVKSFSTLLSAP